VPIEEDEEEEEVQTRQMKAAYCTIKIETFTY
jgi:hypothetical protein